MRNKIKKILSIVVIGIMFGAIPAVADMLDWQTARQGTETNNGVLVLEEFNCTDDNAPNTMLWVFIPGPENTVSGDPTLTLSGSLNESGVLQTHNPNSANYKFITSYTSDLLGLFATASFTGALGTNGGVLTISHGCAGGGTTIPEFPTVALPIAAVIGLVFFFQYRKRTEE
jgi:hypothetical protein